MLNLVIISYVMWTLKFCTKFKARIILYNKNIFHELCFSAYPYRDVQAMHLQVCAWIVKMESHHETSQHIFDDVRSCCMLYLQVRNGGNYSFGSKDYYVFNINQIIYFQYWTLSIFIKEIFSVCCVCIDA